jgi:lysophospholipase L1-like esterase
LVRPFFNWLAAVVIFGLLPAGGFAQTNNQETNFPTRTRRPMPEPANPKLPSLFLIGDSTVRNGQGNGAGGQWGWGDFLAPFFDTNKINVVNRALGGTSSRTFYLNQWPRVLAMLKPGDFVMMQFGHNDGSAINDASRARGTIKGVGDETQEIDNLLTKQPEVVHTFGWYMAKFVADAKAHGTTVIICSPIPHKQRWENGRDFANIAEWDEQVAKNNGAFYFDLTMVIADTYKKLATTRWKLFLRTKARTRLTAARNSTPPASSPD